MKTENNSKADISFLDPQWMIRVAKLSRSAPWIVIREFCPTPSSTDFIKRIIGEQNLFVSSWNNHLTLERGVVLATPVAARESFKAKLMPHWQPAESLQ